MCRIWAVCGSSMVGALTIGGIALPEMIKLGYDRRLASAKGTGNPMRIKNISKAKSPSPTKYHSIAINPLAGRCFKCFFRARQHCIKRK